MLLECHLSAMKTLMESLHDLVDEEDKPSTYRLSGEYVNFLGDELERLGARSGLSLDEAVSLNLREGRAFADASVSPRRWIVRGWTGTHDSFFRYADGKMNPTDEIFIPTCHQYFLKTFEMHHERRHIQHLFASSRREQRRARKARKNLVMYKLAGRRPWNVQMIGNGAEDEPHPWEPLTEPWNNTWDRDGRSWVNRNYSAAVDRREGCLREQSGFVTISRVADFYRAMHKTFDKYGELFERIGDD